jgi:hypothetical protein
MKCGLRAIAFASHLLTSQYQFEDDQGECEKRVPAIAGFPVDGGYR